MSPDRPDVAAYAAAVHNRFTQDWIFPVGASANDIIRRGHRQLVNRARALARDDGHAKRFLGLVQQNVIGPDGMRMEPRNKDARDEFDKPLNRNIKAGWLRWAEDPYMTSADGRSAWVDVENAYMRDIARDGECLIRILEGFDNEFGFAVQVLDPDMLDVEFNRPAGRGQNEIRMGVEIDQWGRPVNYWLWDRHPGDSLSYTGDRERIAVPASQIIHDFVQEYAGQTRGVTWFAAVMLKMRMLDGYQEAELVAARLAASKMGFFEPDAANPPAVPAGSDDPGGFTAEASPGQFDVLPVGYHLREWDPKHPAAAYDAFTRGMLRVIATGLETSYASLTGDLTQVNYSSIRAGLLTERDVWRGLQNRVRRRLHARVYRRWLQWAVTTGQVKLPTRNASRHDAHEFLPRGWAWVDPLKDITATGLAIRLGLESRTHAAGQAGRSLDEIFADLDRENQLADEYEVDVSGGKPAANGPVIQPQDKEDDTEAAALALAQQLMARAGVAHNGNGNGHKNGAKP